jgi:hypothetical protein
VAGTTSARTSADCLDLVDPGIADYFHQRTSDGTSNTVLVSFTSGDEDVRHSIDLPFARADREVHDGSKE